MLSLRLTKGLVLGGMFLITAFFCSLPAWIISGVRTRRLDSHSTRFRNGISFLNCFACGVFLGTLFLDLAPEVNEAFAVNLEKLGIKTDYPLAQFCTVFGFLLVVTVERIVVSCQSDAANILHGHDHGTSKSRSRSREVRQTNNPEAVRERERMARYAMPNPYHPEPSLARSMEVAEERGDFRTRRPSEVSLADNEAEPEILSSVASSRSNSPERAEGGSEGHSGSHSHSHSAHEPGLKLVKSKSHQVTHTARSVVLLLALSLHSIFEGLAVGLQQSPHKVVELFGALLIHKCVVAFSVGMNLMQSHMAFRNVILSAMIFASASPLGIGIGMGMEGLGQDPGSGIASAILQAFACGTFLFVTFMEVLPHEMLKGSQGEESGVTLLKILCIILGFSVMAALMFMDS